MRISAANLAGTVLFVWCITECTQVHPDTIVYTDTQRFLDDHPPPFPPPDQYSAVRALDVYLEFHTNKFGFDSFDQNSFKDRPGDYFSDDVTFSSPDWGAPEQVLWGRVEGTYGWIGPRPSLRGRLRLDFRRPIGVVGFNIGPAFNPGYDIQFFSEDGNLLGEILASAGASSFAGAWSTTPIDHIIIHRTARAYAISRLGFSFFEPVSDPIPEPITFVLFSVGAAGVGLVHRRRRKRNR